MSFLKKQAINTLTVQEGCKGIEQFFFSDFFRLKALESLEKLKFLA